jgi:rare lipoprotein A
MRRLAILIAAFAFLSACGHGKAHASIPKSKTPTAKVSGADLEGVASYYAEPYNGRRTANGEIFDSYNAMTAAHKTLPFNTVVRVKNLNNGEEVDVRINDRGPFVKGRVIDLSLAAAKEIDLVRAGVAPVKLKILKDGSPTTRPSSPAAVSAPVLPPVVPPAIPPPMPPGIPEPVPTPVSPPVPASTEPVSYETALPTAVSNGTVATAILPAYGVQVGAFQSEAAAIALRNNLAMRYSDVSVLAPFGGQTLYRVRVGNVPDMASAQQIAKRLISEQFNTFIVRLN